MSSSLLSIGTQALNANQSALSYTGQNIANVNTEGYTRQRVNFETQQPPILGVGIQDVQRVTDQFLVEQVWRDQSALSSSEQQAKKMELLDKLMVSESTSLSSAMDNYFAALQRTVDDPLFIGNRQLFLAEAESLVSTFRTFDQRLTEQQTAITTEARSMVGTINTITGSIAQLNVKISSLAASGQNYNSLLDDRDQLTKELAKFVSLDVVSSDGGITNNILLANGEPLVSSGRAATMTVRDGSPDPAQIDVFLQRGNTAAKITGVLGEGALGGLFTYRDEVLQPTRSEVGRIALVLTTTMNEQHRKGVDLDGRLGSDLFSPTLQGQVYSGLSNKSTGVTTNLTFYDVTQLTASDYEVEITGVDSFRVKRLTDGALFYSRDMANLEASESVGPGGAFSRDDSGNVGTLTLSLDGFTFTLNSNGKPQKGDQFLLQPTKNAARAMQLAITRPESLALASPLRVTPASSNAGNAELLSIEILDGSDTSPLRPGQLDTPIEIVFNALNADGEQKYSVYDVTDPDNPALIDGMSQLNYTPGEPITINTLAGDAIYQIAFANQPRPGDRFMVEYNTDGVSDNTNALALSDLQRAETANGYSYQDAYGQLLAQVGTKANSITVAYEAGKAVLSASEDALESIRGVNLDEEAARLIQYQQAYTASTRLITAYQDIFDSLISAVR